MIRLILLLLVMLILVTNQIFLQHTDDGLDIQFYDCVHLQSLQYCRRPSQPKNLTRRNDTNECQRNHGHLHRFSELRSNNITLTTLVQQWTSTLEQLEQYSHFIQYPSEQDGLICQCLRPTSFGQNCEYQLPAGETLEETLEWQLTMRKNNSQEVNIHGAVVCYETLQCDSGMLCLDWREICDGIQNCLEGRDEENCDLLEMNQCDQEEEYRCENGMCIAEEFFLDGEMDCLDWSDEMMLKTSGECPLESVNTECDDHFCLPTQWSCGDGECINNRLVFQRLSIGITCSSGRDQYWICETHLKYLQWTMPNGRCFRGDQYESSSVINQNDVEGRCEYLLKCLLTWDLEKNCTCYKDSGCLAEFYRVCPSSLIKYPRGSVVTPFTFFLFNLQRDWSNDLPDFIEINGTARCRNASITVREKIIPFDFNLNDRRIIDEHFCGSFVSNTSLSAMFSTRHWCHHENESSDVCQEWNQCLSPTRIRDGWNNCLNERDEQGPTEIEIDKSCASVRRHRFRCSREQSACLSVIALGDLYGNCRNRFDELLFGVGRTISSLGCNNQRQDQCSFLRQYIEQSSSKSTTNNDIQRRSRIPFRYHCDTFSDLEGRKDENLVECQKWWICPDDQHRCPTGQCREPNWIDDWEWDCADAQDEHDWINRTTVKILEEASKYNFTRHSFFVPSSCPQESHPFLCLSAEATRQGFSCFNWSQIGDGRIDCAGGHDERNTLQYCSQSSLSMSTLNFLCRSTNTCIPFFLHCWTDQYRCPNRSDDKFWCDRQRRPGNCSGLNDFVCFNGQCLEGGRCNRHLDCLFGEDEEMCDYSSSVNQFAASYREWKRLSRERTSSIFLHFSSYPHDINIAQMNSQSTIAPLSTSITSLSSSPYWCNRGLGVLSTNNHSTIVCFCPPHYYGHKCQFHQDRLSVVLHLDLSSTIQIDRNHPNILLKLLVVFLFNDDQVLMINQFHLHPSVELDSLLNQKRNKFITYFFYSRSSTSLVKRRQRFFNRSSLLSRSPYSIRVELYQTYIISQPSIIAVWKYPLSFSHLPVSRLAKILRFAQSSSHRSPCLSNPCGSNQQCHQLMNNKSLFVCLCKTNFTGENCSEEDPRCLEGYCNSTKSLCQPKSHLAHRGKTSPFCLCPLNHYGKRCEIEYDQCLFSPCLNGGSCFPDVRIDRVICLCQKAYFGDRCQWKRSSIQLSLSTDLRYRGVVLQFLQIDLTSLEFILLQQQVFLRIPPKMEYYHQDQSSITGIVLAKVYSSSEALMADLYLLSVYENIFSIDGRTNLSSINRCEHQRTIAEDSSPIRYHQICRNDSTRLCFRDDTYLCLCTDNHSRVECFLYDDQLDRCSQCLVDGRCLQGNPRQPHDFVCLCPACHSGRQCQFNTKSFSFTLDQLFSPDLLSHQRQTTTISLLIFSSLLTFFLALPNNLFSFFTLRRPSCLRYGVGHYLLWMSFINQLSLTLLLGRLLHLTLNSTSRFSSSSTTNDFFCKSLNYLLSSSTRMVYWLTSLISIERLYSTLSLRGQWLKQPRIARRLILFTIFVVLITDLYELFFYKSFSTQTDGESRGSICVLDISSQDRSVWMTFHLLFLILHSLLPFLINLFSTITICLIIIKKKIKTSKKIDPTDQVRQSLWRNMRQRSRLIADVLHKNKEFVLGPAITLVPQLFSLPLFISSFVFDCQNLDDSWLRHFLIVSYWISFTPHWTSFFLYIAPSSLFSNEWRQTKLGRWVNTL